MTIKLQLIRFRSQTQNYSKNCWAAPKAASRFSFLKKKKNKYTPPQKITRTKTFLILKCSILGGPSLIKKP